MHSDGTGFAAADAGARLAERLLGRRWVTADDVPLEVPEVKVTRRRWPILLRFTVENDDWSVPRNFEWTRSAQDTVRGIHPAANAEATAEDELALLELHLRTGQPPGLVELT